MRCWRSCCRRPEHTEINGTDRSRRKHGTLGRVMTQLPVITSQPPALTLSPARRSAMPPRHLADLDLAGRRAALAELGEQPFRAGQLSAHYFGRLVRDPAGMTDLP